MNIQCVKAGVFGGLTFFFWSMVMWMAVNLHAGYHQSLPLEQEAAITEFLKNNIPQKGLYIYPSMQETDHQLAAEKMQKGPFFLMMIHPQGTDPSMATPMLLGVLANIVVAIIVAWIISQCGPLTFWKQVRVGILTIFAGMFLPVFAQWNWWGYPNAYLFTMIFDFIVGWTLANMAIVRTLKKNT